MKCNPWVGGSIGRRGFPMLGTGKRGLSTYVKDIFRNGEQGFFYDPNDLSTMYQDAAGTVPVTAAGQPVGLVLDKSKGLALGAELVVDSEFNDATKWVLTAGASVRGGKLNVTASVGGSARQNFALKQAGTYKVTLKVDSASGSDYTVRLHNGGSVVPTFAYTSGVGTKSWIITATSPFDALVLQFGGGSGLTAVFDSLYVVELKGNHAYQTTSAARPILRDTPRRIDFDAVDDKLITNLPTQVTGCTVIRSVPNVGTQILTGQTIPATYNDNTDHCGLIVINRALTPSETSAIATEFNKRAGV